MVHIHNGVKNSELNAKVKTQPDAVLSWGIKECHKYFKGIDINPHIWFGVWIWVYCLAGGDMIVSSK